MAITIKTKPSISLWGMRSTIAEPTPSTGILKTYTIVLHEDGQISFENTDSKELNLGKQGDSNVTLLKFNTDELKLGDLSNYYFQIAVKNITLNSVIGTFLINNQEFLIPSIISDYAGDYEFIIILKDKNISNGNRESEQEYFITNPFKAKIYESAYSGLITAGYLLEPVNEEELNIIKQQIIISVEKDTITSDSRILGNKNDRNVLYFNWTEYERTNNIDQIIMAVCSDDEVGGFEIPQTQLNNNVFWVPESLTAKSGEYKIGFLIKGWIDEKEYSFLTNMLTFKVQDNWLTDEDLVFDFTDSDDNNTFIKDLNGDLLKDIDGYLLYTLEVEDE